MRVHSAQAAVALVSILGLAARGYTQETADPIATAERLDHRQSAERHAQQTVPGDIETPPLPASMTLDEVLEYAAGEPPASFPDPVPDDEVYVFTYFEQLEYRSTDNQMSDQLGWEAQGWAGGDIHRFWWKSEGEAVFDGPDEGESENDFLYSRLMTPFWNVQAGVQYANEWHDGDYDDRWSAVIGVQGLAPFKFELDHALYVSEGGDVTLTVEGEYDLRITQRLVLQPRAEIRLSAQDIPERGLGSGATDATVDLRLRYEIRRELAPYLLFRYSRLVGETADIAEAAGFDTTHRYFGAGLRFAF